MGSEVELEIVRRLDHLVYAGPNLEAAIERVQGLTGIRATAGGQHPGWGTRNALVSLGSDVFLEIIAPDPEQAAPQFARVFGIDALDEPRLVTWAARSDNLQGLLRSAAEAGIGLGAIAAARRVRPDGAHLSWHFTDPRTVIAEGIVPFFIDWGAAVHPSKTGAQGATLASLRAVHPDPEPVQRMLRALDIDLIVTQGQTPALIATLDTPRGQIELQ